MTTGRESERVVNIQKLLLLLAFSSIIATIGMYDLYCKLILMIGYEVSNSYFPIFPLGKH